MNSTMSERDTMTTTEARRIHAHFQAGHITANTPRAAEQIALAAQVLQQERRPQLRRQQLAIAWTLGVLATSGLIATIVYCLHR